MTQGGSLRHGRHVHHAEGDADSGSNDQRNQDPLVRHHFRVKERGANSQGSTDLASQNPSACSRRRAQEPEGENEENNRGNVGEIKILLKCERGHACFDLPDLNMRSMRSVIRNPPTILLNDAATAIAPNTSVSRVSCRPAMMMAATTTIASRAFVSDISGVWSSGETRLMTSKPTNPARMKT